mgnify:CR=1 FL=1
MNVNLQMNYWPTYSANLAECATPIIDYVNSLREPGRVTAEKYFGIASEPGEANGFSALPFNVPFFNLPAVPNFNWRKPLPCRFPTCYKIIPAQAGEWASALTHGQEREAAIRRTV